MNLRIALRSLWKKPGFAVISLLVLALGIGANTAIFSVVNALLLRPLPYRNADRILSVMTLWVRQGSMGNVSAPDFRDWEQQSRSFEAMGLYAAWPESVVANGVPDRIHLARVGSGFFPVMGAEPSLGRLFAGEEMSGEGAPVAVISYSLWQRLYHGDPQVLGQSMKILQHSVTVVGVLPRGFGFPEDSEIWVPYGEQNYAQEHRTAHNFQAVALLKPGVPLAQAQAEMTGLASRIAEQYPEDANKSVALVPMQERLVKNFRLTLYLLMAAVALVLLIACANVANLLLARVTQRRQEMAVRAALGASRSRILQQLVGESLVLALPAGALGLMLGWWGAQAVTGLAPADLPRFNAITLDWRVAIFAAAAAIISSVLFGLAPAWHAGRVDLNDVLRAGGSHSVVRGGAGRLGSAIVVGELAISTVLLVGAVLLFRSLLALSATDPGFRYQDIAVMDSSVPASDLETARQAVGFYRDLLASAAAMPQMEGVAAVNTLPNRDGSNGQYLIEGRPAPAQGDWETQQAGFMLVSPGYFRLLGIPVRSGRDVGERDGPDGPLTCIVNQALARDAFPNDDPIGQRLETGYDSVPDGTHLMTIVGVVGDVRQYDPKTPPEPIIYMPYQQHPLPATEMKVLFRAPGGPSTAMTALRAEAKRLNPEVPTSFLPLVQTLQTALAPSRFRTLLLALFAGLAGVLAIVGLYGVMSYTVSQRTREIGMRIALGAAPGRIVGMVLGQGLRLVLPGVVAGVALSLAAGKMVTSFVYGIRTSDPITLAAVSVLLAGVAVASMAIPARRAARVDPMVTLRQD